VELYGYDEDRGLLKLVLVEGTMIEVPFKNEYGEPIWVKGRVSSTTEGSLKFKFRILGELDHENWVQTLSRADMESTWRLPPATRIGQLGVDAMLSTQGYTPWHHSSHGSHWLRLQPRGASKYKTHNVRGRLQEVTFGWRLGWRLGLPMGQTGYHAGGHEFTMSSFVEDHMSKEDLGVGATTQEWSDLKKLGRELRRWDNLPIDPLGKWSQVPPRVPEGKGPRPRSRGRKNRGKGIYCFLGSTRVRMATTNWRSTQYKRMDKLVKGDKIWTRLRRRDCRELSQGQVSIVECVMTFACPPEGQLMVEVDGNFLTPDHHVAKGRGKWSTAGALTELDTDSTTQLTHMVYNIKLQSGGQIEIGNKVYAATLGARFDTVEVGQDPIYSADTTRYLQDLPEFSSGYIHWAWGTASVDQHGMPRPKSTQAFPSEIGSSTLLDPEILETIFTRQYADQG